MSANLKPGTRVQAILLDEDRTELPGMEGAVVPVSEWPATLPEEWTEENTVIVRWDDAEGRMRYTPYALDVAERVLRVLDAPTDSSGDAVTATGPASSDDSTPEPFDLDDFMDAATGAPAADVLTDTPEPFSVEGMVIASGWLAEHVGECTCGGVDQYGHECHESGCGLEPVARLDDLPGWPRTSRPTTAEGVAAIKKRLQWASIHWGTQKVSEDAWPHIADAVLSLWDAEGNR